jgi:hypothetical protein
MTRAVGLVLAVGLLAGGCRTTGGKLGGTLAGTGAIVGLITTPICAGEPDAGGCTSSEKDALGLIALGAIVGGVAIAIISEASYKRPVVTEPVESPAMTTLSEPVAARDPQAHEMTVEAHQAAWQGQCAGLPALAQRVDALDADYYARVFYADPAIQRCMQSR